MTDILRLTLIILLLTVTLSAYFLVIGALFTARVAKTQASLNLTPGRSFGLGMVNFFFFGTIALILLMLIDGNANRVNDIVRVILFFPAVGVLAFLGILLSFGLAGIVQELGSRIAPEHEPRKQLVIGSALLTIACALPFVGWFLLLPYVTFTGIGATILGFFQKS